MAKHDEMAKRKRMIRPYRDADFESIRMMHIGSGLPQSCLPDLRNPNFKVRIVEDDAGKVVQFGAVKLTGEAYILVDHRHGSPVQRHEVLERLIACGLSEAASVGLDDVSAWLPPMLEKSFGPRLEALGWVRSPWRSYSAVLR